MEIRFDHEKLDVYRSAVGFIAWVDELLNEVHPGMAAKDHLWRASESLVRNIVRANSKRTPADRACTFDVAYASALECAACLDVLCAWKVTEQTRSVEGKVTLDRIVAMLIGIRSAKPPQVNESHSTYELRAQGRSECFFSHEQLRTYQSALRFVRWSVTLIQSSSLGLSRGRELDRHATGVVLNMAEGNGKFSMKDRKRFLDTAVSAGLQAASSLDILAARTMITQKVSDQGKEHMREIVSMIAAMARSLH